MNLEEVGFSYLGGGVIVGSGMKEPEECWPLGWEPSGEQAASTSECGGKTMTPGESEGEGEYHE